MSGYIGTQPVPQATQTRDSFTATSGQTTFATGGYTPNFLDVYLNGVKLAAADYTASNGSDVVLASGAATGDILEVVAFTTFNSASSSIDDNGNATAITIDSSENVLIGQTVASSGTVGTSLRPDGRNFYCADGNYSAHFNRNSSDGAIVHFAKDDTIVGSIQSRAGVVSTIILDPRSGVIGTGITGSGANLSPTDGSGAEVDARNDLGKSDYRFKDLYLSGGVYLGGTGSANKLEDYEEGTCNLTIKDSSNNSATMTGYVCKYVKIGSLVHVTGTLTWSSTSALNASRIQIHGLPFAAAPSVSGGTNRSPVSNGTSSANSFTIPREEIAFGIDPNANFIWGSHVTGNNYDGHLTKQHFGTSGVLYSLQAIYETNA
jgi:hypothetical protein